MKTTVLITGGTGFLGRRLAATLRAEYDVVLGARNNNQNIMAREVTGCNVLPLDVTNIESVRDVFGEVKPNIIIHAAATKFVDLAEKFPLECIDVNVLGSQNVARVAIENDAEMVVGICTDKAAPPIRNTYGLSKALMERMFCGLDSKSETKFTCVRFGNIAWSTGSVFPAWKRMHDETGVIRSTGPEMRRFFFTVDEAVRLVRTAIDEIEAVHGCVLSRKMKAAQIKSLLTVWIEARGGRWERMEGRPGEREEEFLVGEIELPYTSVAKYDGIDHYIISFNEKAIEPLEVALSSTNAEQLSAVEMLNIINDPAG